MEHSQSEQSLNIDVMRLDSEGVPEEDQDMDFFFRDHGTNLRVTALWPAE